MTICEYLHAWLNSTHEQSPKTLERHRELADRQIIPHLGSVKLQKLRPEYIKEWHGKLLSAGLAARTVGHAHRVLSLVLKRAVENGTLARNVAAIRKAPAVEEQEIEILSTDQVTSLLDGLRDHWLPSDCLPCIGNGHETR